MRTIRNLIWFFLAFGLTVFSGMAFAAPTVTRYTLNSDFPGQSFESPDVACDALVQKIIAAGNPNAYCRPPHTTSQIRFYNRGNSTAQLGRINACADGSPPNMSMPLEQRCPEPDPDPDPPGQCMSDDSEQNGEWHVGSTGGITKGPLRGGAPTDGQCCIKITNVKSCQHYPQSDRPKDLFCTYAYVRIGGVCGVDADSKGPDNPGLSNGARSDMPSTDSPQGPCPKGTVQVGVNADGIPRCAGSGSDPKNPKPKPPTIQKQDTQQNPDGSTTTTTTTTTTNDDGSTTTVVSKTTTGSDGKKTTTEDRDTSKAPSGTPGKDDSKQDDEKYDLCKQNPQLSICKNSSVSGKCGEVSCDGDAIQCATLRAAAAMQCKQQTDEDQLNSSPLTAKGNSAINGTDLEGLPNAKNAQVMNIPTLGGQGWLGNGSAFKDISITVQNKTIVVPLSKWSDYLLPFRYIMMIIASLISYRILAGSISRA